MDLEKKKNYKMVKYVVLYIITAVFMTISIEQPYSAYN